RGEKLGRSAPKRAKSYVEPIVAINSIPQHEVANGSGHREFALASPITLSKDVAKNPAPSTPGGASANVTLLMIFCYFAIYHNLAHRDLPRTLNRERQYSIRSRFSIGRPRPFL